jgi:hypothetical protein
MNPLVIVFGVFVCLTGLVVVAISSDRSVSLTDVASNNYLSVPVSGYSGYSPASVEMFISNVDLNKSGSDVNLRWDVVGGVGCCNSFDCDFNLFRDSCLIPFRLYDLYLDDVWVNVSYDSNYFYTCADVIPYNFRYWGDLSLGQHYVKIVERGCSDNVFDVEVVDFVVYNDSVVIM